MTLDFLAVTHHMLKTRYISNSAKKFHFGKINGIGKQNSHVANNFDNYKS
jgi:hypothetical protein